MNVLKFLALMALPSILMASDGSVPSEEQPNDQRNTIDVLRALSRIPSDAERVQLIRLLTAPETRVISDDRRNAVDFLDALSRIPSQEDRVELIRLITAPETRVIGDDSPNVLTSVGDYSPLGATQISQGENTAPAEVGEFRPVLLHQPQIDSILAIYQSNLTRDPSLPGLPDPKRAGKDFTDIERGMAMSVMQIAPKTPDGYKTALRLIFSDEHADVLLDHFINGDFIPA